MYRFFLFLLCCFFFSFSGYAQQVLKTSTGFVYPVHKKHSGEYLGFGSKNRYYGMSCHLANDYKVEEGTPVYAVGLGVVQSVNSYVGNYGGDTPAKHGGAIIIKHFLENGDDFYALYGHVQNFR